MQRNVLDFLENGPLRSVPSKAAIVDGGTVLTFGQLAAGAKAGALRILEAAPARRNGPIAIFLPKSAAAVVAALAALYSGNFYVPLDVKSPPARLRSVLKNLNPAVVCSAPEFASALMEAGVEAERILCLSDGASACGKTAGPRGWQTLVDADPVYTIYTSGSTGTPKGVVISHRGVIDYINWALDQFAVGEHTVIGSQSPFYFDNSSLDLYLCLATGATVVLVPEQLYGFPARLLPYLKEQGVNFIFWVPSVLVNAANQQALDGVDLPELRHILFAGEVMPARHLNYWRRHFPSALFANLYGPTEITVDCTCYIVDRDFPDDASIPIGTPCRNSEILILNEEDHLAAVNEPGELCVRGSSLALGYWNNPEQTAAAFVQNPLNKRYPEVIYRTGDRAFWNERGEIEYLGRKDFQIKHQGYRIELGEIEMAVIGLPEICHACVVYNEPRKEITLFFESTAPLEPADIRTRMLDKLPKYMLPTAFHRLPAMPLNANGKVDRQALIGKLT